MILRQSAYRLMRGLRQWQAHDECARFESVTEF
jgi:hypothetical protein